MWQPHPSVYSYPDWYALPVQKTYLLSQYVEGKKFLCAAIDYQPSVRFKTKQEALDYYDSPERIKAVAKFIESYKQNEAIAKAHNEKILNA